MSSHWRAFWFRDAPAVAYIVAVFLGGTVLSAPGGDVSGVGFDKVGHLLAFAAMFFLLLRAVSHELPKASWRWHLGISFAGASAVGGALELYQATLPHRSADVLDWAADCLGAALALAVAYWRAARHEAHASAQAAGSQPQG